MVFEKLSKAQVAASKFIFLRVKNSLKSLSKEILLKISKKKFEKFKIHDGLF